MTTLDMWTIYFNPRDYPDLWVARRFVIGGGPVPQPTADMFVADSLAEVRALLPCGLAMIPRDPTDDYQIVETWL
jgi:hypothetical protein